MATKEEIKTELIKTELRLDEAMKNLRTFEEGEDDGVLLKALRRKVRSDNLNEEEKEEKKRLGEEEKRLKKNVDDRLKQVEELQKALAGFDKKDYDFRSCSDSFFSHLPTIVENNNWLEFAYPIPLTEYQKLYIRSSYKVIAKDALSKANPNRRKYSIISGTPGIGKSMFLFYIFWQLVKEGKRVLFVTRQPAIYFDGNSTFEYPQYPLSTDHQFWTFDLWCLVDSKDPTNIPGFPVDACSVILSTTPRSDFISGFSKLVPAPPVFYMPLWTREELEVVAPLYSNVANIWMNRFELLGGVPRLVLEQTEQDPTSILISACKQCKLEDCIKLVSIHSEITPKTKIIQTLIHLKSSPPYKDATVIYASETAMKTIAHTKWTYERQKMQSLLGSCAGNPLAAALCGYIFEPHAIDLLEQGGTFQCRELVSGRKSLKSGSFDLKIPKSRLPPQVVDRVEENQTHNQLYIPKTKNYAAIDAWMPNFGGFQMTVGKNHDIKGGTSSDLEKLGPHGNKLYFLLPPLHFESFTKKTPQSINQFAILIPYPEKVQ